MSWYRPRRRASRHREARPGPDPAATAAAAAPGWRIWAPAAVCFAAYAVLSVRRHQRLVTSGFDLGIFEQVVRSYAHGHLPVVALKGAGFQELGDHFSPVLATLAPGYWLWPSPLLLLLAQAALLAVAAVPLTRWARQTLGTGASWVVGLGYGASWGIASAVGFDFHEICFAVPLLAFSLTALGQGRLGAAAAWALPLLLVKEDLGLTVAVIGAVIVRRGGRRLGLLTAAAGIAGSALEVLVVIPAFSPGGHYTYLDNLGSANAGPPDLPGVLYQLTVGLAAAPYPKPLTLVLLVAPTAFLALRSSLLLVAVPTLIWRFASDDPLYWGMGAHYSAILMPIVFAALLDALARRRPSPSDLRHLLVVVAGVTVVLLPQFPLFQLAQPSAWREDPRIAGAHRIMDLIPDGATVAAANHLVPQLTDRATVTEFGLPAQPPPQWIVVDTETPQDWPVPGTQQPVLLDQARAGGYCTVADADGYLLLRRSGAATGPDLCPWPRVGVTP